MLFHKKITIYFMSATREKFGIWSSAFKKSRINCDEIYEYCQTEITIFQLFTVLDELMGDGDYLTDKFPDADLDPRHNLSNDILDYNTNVTDKKFKYISDSYLAWESCLFFKF